jgi:hypothetical protein
VNKRMAKEKYVMNNTVVVNGQTHREIYCPFLTCIVSITQDAFDPPRQCCGYRFLLHDEKKSPKAEAGSAQVRPRRYDNSLISRLLALVSANDCIFRDGLVHRLLLAFLQCGNMSCS